MLKELKVKRAIKGDEKAFIDLINGSKENLYKIAYSYVKNEQDALDIVQETVYKAYVSIDRLKNPRYFSTWLTKILINISINTINKNKKVMYLEEVTVSDGYEDNHREDKMDILCAINKLDERYQNIIKLRYFNDLTIIEISRVLEIPIGTAKTHLNRGLSELRRIIGGELKYYGK